MENGINICAYNYRGYGLSEGTPSIDKLRVDAETVALYVRQRVGQTAKVGAHGTSIGGAVATYLARRGYVDFLFADRTFCALDEVAKYTLGNWAKYGLRFLTGWWNTDLTRDFIFASCYKVLSQDA